MDLQCERSLKPLQQFEVVAPAAHPMGVSNGFFMAAPQHPFLKRLVDNLKRFNRHWVFLPYPTVMLSTGCYYMSYVICTFPKHPLALLPLVTDDRHL
jgi:mannosyltransferase OCH1-like enzyme